MTTNNDSARYMQLGEELLQLETRKTSLQEFLLRNDDASPSKIRQLGQLQSRIDRIMDVMKAFRTL
jgi:hypothetical protein